MPWQTWRHTSLCALFPNMVWVPIANTIDILISMIYLIRRVVTNDEEASGALERLALQDVSPLHLTHAAAAVRNELRRDEHGATRWYGGLLHTLATTWSLGCRRGV